MARAKGGWAIALHGGAGDFPRTMTPERRQLLEGVHRHSLQIGIDALKANQSPLDVVELVVRELEDNPHFNAGKGSDLAGDGGVEMEAAIMDGAAVKCGAVSGLTTGVETMDPSHFMTLENIEKLKQAEGGNSVQPTQEAGGESSHANGVGHVGTVGCVAFDGNGSIAAATSTSGSTNKMVGRSGVTPLIGAGTYANYLCAVSATGDGEAIICATVAREVATLMEYKGLSLREAAACVVGERAPRSAVGLIAVSATGV